MGDDGRVDWQVEAKRRHTVVVAAFEAAMDCEVLRYDAPAHTALKDMRTDGLLSDLAVHQLRGPIDADERTRSRVRVMRDVLLVIGGWEDAEATLYELFLHGTDEMARAIVTALGIWFELEGPPSNH